MGKRLYNKSVNQSWTMKEQIFLHENYFKLPIDELAIKLQRSYGQIHAKASDLGLNLHSMKKTKPFTTLKIIPVPSTPANKSEVVDKPKATRQSCGKQKAWTKEDDDYIVQMYNFMSYSQIADKLQTTSQVLDHRIRKLKAEGRLTKRVSNKKVAIKKVAPKKVSVETSNKKVNKIDEPMMADPLQTPVIVGLEKTLTLEERAKENIRTSSIDYNELERMIRKYKGLPGSKSICIEIEELKVKELTSILKVLEDNQIKFELR